MVEFFSDMYLCNCGSLLATASAFSGIISRKDKIRKYYFTVSRCIFDSLDFIYTNQYTFYAQMYQSLKYTLKSLKTLYDSLQHVSISYEIIFREVLILFLVEVTEFKNY
jgi:hypothetical protein